MAWRSSGANNDDMVDKLKRFRVIKSGRVEEGFRRVDRKHFVPSIWDNNAHSDIPLRAGNVHLSAPHIYASSIEALDLVPNSTISFLNIGSGTGYISCVAAEILGPNSLNYGVELQCDVVEHCKKSIPKWKTSIVDECGGASVFRFADGTADIRVIRGNGLNILDGGEAVAGFDRIYVGAAVDEEDLAKVVRLMSPGGILVGPVGHQLLKIVRVGNTPPDVEHDSEGNEDDVSSVAGILGEEFAVHLLSGVNFVPLESNPAVETFIPAGVWSPSVKRGYPSEFGRAYAQLLMCSNSELVQPLPRVPNQDERLNAAAMLPKSIWLEVLSYTHRKWFETEQNETDYLKRRLREEKAARKEAEDNCLVAEKRYLAIRARCRAAERERAVFRLLARRWQSRLDSELHRREDRDEGTRRRDEANDELSVNMDLAGDARRAAVAVDERSTLSDLIAALQQLNDNTHDEGEDVESEEDESDGNVMPGLEVMPLPDLENQDEAEDDTMESDEAGYDSMASDES